MTEWNEVDLLTCFESDPEVDADRLWYRYTVERGGYKLVFELWPYDEDVHVLPFGACQQLPLTEVWLHGCLAVRYAREGNVESLSFVNRDYNRFESASFKSLDLRVRPEFCIDVTR